MFRDRFRAWVVSTSLIATATASLAPPVVAQSPPPPPAPVPIGSGAGQSEVLARGPVHEAFAEPIVFDADAPALIVPRQPPEPITERPPDQQPVGRNVAWIPGYWAWDDARSDFIWISGLWRDIPPGRQWAPGYWARVEGGFRWVSGTWGAIAQEAPDQTQAQARAETSYLPAPPASMEVGPNIVSPGPGYFWAPGCWVWQGATYAWQPGYWTAVQTNWVWVPRHYAWTPGGFLCVPGYWDYTLVNRGLLFAPVVIPQTVYVQPAFVYTPTVVIQQTVLVQHLFCRPSYGHYYFGDYYDPGFRQSGFVAWFEFGGGGGFGGGGRRGGYDPIYAQAAAVGRRDDPMWERRVQMSYERRVADPGLRPAQTYLAMRREASLRRSEAREESLVAPLTQVAASNPMNVRLQRIDEQRREAIERRGEALRTFQKQLVDQETRLAAVRAEAIRSRPQAAFQPQPTRLPVSPIAARQAAPRPNSEPGAAAQAAAAARAERLKAYQEQVQKAQAERAARQATPPQVQARPQPQPRSLPMTGRPLAAPAQPTATAPGSAAQAMAAARAERVKAYQEQVQKAQAERAARQATPPQTQARPQFQPRQQPLPATRRPVEPQPNPTPEPGAAAQAAAAARAERLKAYQDQVQKAQADRAARQAESARQRPRTPPVRPGQK
jgi:hypothetical protein